MTGATEGYTTLDEAEAEGLFHPNCRHTYDLYIDENNPELGIIGETDAEEQKQLEELYPNEKWDWNSGEKASDKSSVFVAPSREDASHKSNNATAVFEQEKEMAAKLAEELKRNVYLIPENSSQLRIKQPDAMLNGQTLEMKRVTGSRDKIGANVLKALKQSDNVFLYIENNTPIKSCLDKIYGSLKSHGKKEEKLLNRNGKLYIYTESKLYTFTWKAIIP